MRVETPINVNAGSHANINIGDIMGGGVVLWSMALRGDVKMGGNGSDGSSLASALEVLCR